MTEIETEIETAINGKVASQPRRGRERDREREPSGGLKIPQLQALQSEGALTWHGYAAAMPLIVDARDVVRGSCCVYMFARSVRRSCTA